ncbi:MAG: hypothetical protein F6J90_15625 [Moorea sp. SIOASIH]|uniref:hypothetical protein n=1 Tax=Moorena sp. SIOASIH TaxID=2607817 RepID=UPI0013B67C05|nr:hypothetical protein [Moorena sp. SIOASIH]NEO37680.1 hypothetical protein [Moorena sp. SIOASIH]
MRQIPLLAIPLIGTAHPKINHSCLLPLASCLLPVPYSLCDIPLINRRKTRFF